MLHEALRDARRLLLPAVLLAAVMVALGLLVTKVLPGTGFGRWEASVPRDLVDNREGGSVPESLIITTAASTPAIVVLAALAVVVCRLVFKRWRESLFVAYAVGGEVLIFLVTTIFIDRPRPRVPKLDIAPPTSSFPSGHTAASLCFYGAIAALVMWHARRGWLRALAVAVAVAIPLAVGGSRIYRGMHYPTDVLGGLVLGSAWLTVVVLYVLRRDEGDHPDRLSDADRATAAKSPR